MARPTEGHGRYELNEEKFWANWAEATWVSDCCYTLRSAEFPEWFFNHGGFVSPGRDSAGAISKAEDLLGGLGMEPFFLLEEAPGYGEERRLLESRGYAAVDEMSVMEMAEPSLRVNADVSVKVVDGDSEVRDWCTTYLLAFYGDAEKIDAVTKVARRMSGNKDVRMLLAMHGESPAGALAMYRSDGAEGLYCVGTAPDFRQRGVATTMIDAAHSMARREGEALILQTLLSDSVEPLYLGLGFRRLYLKSVMTRRRGPPA